MDAGELLAESLVTLRPFPGGGIEGSNAVIEWDGYNDNEDLIANSDD